MEAGNLQLIDALLTTTPKDEFPRHYAVPDWRQAIENGDARSAAAELRPGSHLALVPSRPQSGVFNPIGGRLKLPSYSSPFAVGTGESEAELLLSRTPTLRSIAFPLYREKMLELAAMNEDLDGKLVLRQSKSWKNRIVTPEGVPKELDLVVSTDVSRPVSTSGRLSKREVYLERIVDHLFTLGVKSQMELEEERKKVEANLRVFGAKVRINELILRPLLDAERGDPVSTPITPPSRSLSFEEKFSERLSFSLPRVSFDSSLTAKTGFGGVNFPFALMKRLPKPLDVEKGGENEDKWPIDADILRKALRLPLLNVTDDEDF